MADKSNPYDLAGRTAKGQPDLPPRREPLTEAEQRAKLDGYIVIPRDFWPNVKYGVHVRFTKKTGEFQTGGFVLMNPFDTKVRGGAEEKRFVKLQNDFNKASRDHKEWIVAYEDIEYFYAKGSGTELSIRQDLQSAVTTLSSNIQRLADFCKKLEKQIASIEQRLGQ